MPGLRISTLSVVAIVLTGGSLPLDRAYMGVAHDFHVSYGRMAVEESIAVIQIRFFKDDLSESLQGFYERDHFELSASPTSDSLFMNYFNGHFRLDAGDERVNGFIASSGEDFEGQEEIWWYSIQFEASTSLQLFTLTNSLLLDRFGDQKNIVKVQHFPSEKSFSYYFDEQTTTIEIDFREG